MRLPGGFTAVELLSVLGVVAVVIAMIAPGYLNGRARRSLQACRGELKTVEEALNKYRDRTSHYPAKLAELVPRDLSHLPVCQDGGEHAFVRSGGSETGFEFVLSCRGAHSRYARSRPIIASKPGLTKGPEHSTQNF